MKKMHYLIIGAILGSLFLVSCKTHHPSPKKVNTVENENKTFKKTYIPDKRVIIDPNFDRTFEIYALNQSTTADGFLKIQLEIKNKSTRHKVLDYQFVWFDLEGMKVDTPVSIEKRARVKPGDVAYVQTVAPSSKIKDFKVNLQLK